MKVHHSIQLLICVLLGATVCTSQSGADDIVITADDLRAMANRELELPVYWDVPAIAFRDQEDREFTPANLHGHVWIANFIFTQCTAACPTITANMVMLQRQIADPTVRFVSFSVDPKNDSPEILKHYAQRWNADESRWLLLATQEESLKQLSTAMNVETEPSDDPTNPIFHTNLFFLIDADGKVRGIYNSGDRETMSRLVQHAKHLLSKNPPTTQPLADLDGAGVYMAMGCAACHNDSRLGPALGGIFGRTIALEDGKSIVADESYVRRAIVEPGAHIVAGYRNSMPSYGDALPNKKVALIVEYLRTLKSDGHAGAVTRAIDPVCKMEVTVTDKTLSHTSDGKTYHFCAETCRESFAKDPAKYARE